MSKRDPRILLEDILMAIQKIRRYTSQLDHDAFLTNDLVIDGVARNLEIIGEAVRQLPEGFRNAHTQIQMDADCWTAKPNCPRLLWS